MDIKSYYKSIYVSYTLGYIAVMSITTVCSLPVLCLIYLLKVLCFYPSDNVEKKPVGSGFLYESFMNCEQIPGPFFFLLFCRSIGPFTGMAAVRFRSARLCIICSPIRSLTGA